MFPMSLDYMFIFSRCFLFLLQFLQCDSCCGVIEIFPQSEGCSKDQNNLSVCEFHKRKAHGNHVRYLGYQYLQVTALPNSFTNVGTIVDVTLLENNINSIMKSMISKR